jgi:general secretion pathway protein L
VARGAATLRNTLKQAIDGASFLTERKGARPPTIDVMLDLTRRLPADTWLQRFSVNADQVQLQGQSREAAALITLLQQSPYLEGPALQGAITPDARTGKEQFLIQAKLRNPPAPAAPAAPAATPAAPPEAPVTPASGPKPEPVPVAQPEKPDAVAS